MQEQWDAGNGDVDAVSMGPTALQQTLMNADWMRRSHFRHEVQTGYLSAYSVCWGGNSGNRMEFWIPIRHKVD